MRQASRVSMRWSRSRRMLWCTAAVIALAAGDSAAQFDSGSTGADGALDFAASPPGTVIDFDPTTFDPPLDPDGDGVYHFTTITIPANVTVKLRANKAGAAPVHWLAQGAVTIGGTLDLNGEAGHGASPAMPRVPSVPGPGGFGGGIGARVPNTPPQPGFGPGAGCVPNSGAGHATAGGDWNACLTNEPYGNAFLLPLIGGSGGGGGGSAGADGAGGGAGGGAILIASSTSISVSGIVRSNGGNNGGSGGGGGSGGAIRLVAPTFGGAGGLTAAGGVGFRPGGVGRIRVETLQNTFTGTTSGDARATTLVPNPILLPTTPQPQLKILTVDGVPVPPKPLGRFDMVDVMIDDAGPVDIVLEGHNIPLDATITVTVINETEGTSTSQTSPVPGTEELWNASVTMTFASGFSHIFTHAEWAPPPPAATPASSGARTGGAR